MNSIFRPYLRYNSNTKYELKAKPEKEIFKEIILKQNFKTFFKIQNSKSPEAFEEELRKFRQRQVRSLTVSGSEENNDILF